jgi:hypothetical protein
MSDIVADLAALRGLRDKCVELATLFEDETHDGWSRQVDEVGTERLRSALAGFEHHWKDGRTKVKRHLQALTERVQAAIEQYEQTEGDLAQRYHDAGTP